MMDFDGDTTLTAGAALRMDSRSLLARLAQLEERLNTVGTVPPVLRNLNDMDLAILVMLARLGRLLTRHIHVIWLPNGSERTMRWHLRRLRDYRLIVSAPCSMPPDANGYRPKAPPRYVGPLYVLTEAGERLMEEVYPIIDFKVEKVVTQGKGSILHQAEHQIEYADLLIAILRQLPTVPGFVGVSTAPEILLGPDLRPRCDGFLLFRRWNDATRGTLDGSAPFIPWLVTPKIAGEQTDKTYAVEIDRNTESAHIIAAKAKSYRTLFESGWWHGKYRWPTPLWVVPTDNRREVVLREWLAVWPEAPILITTRPQLEDAGIDAPIWTEVFRGQRNDRRALIAPDWWEPHLRYPDPAPGGRR